MRPAQANGLNSLVNEPANRLPALIDHLFNGEAFARATRQVLAAVPLSMWEDENNYYVEVDAPGLSENDIDVALQHGVLTISGERKRERADASFDNRTYGKFSQQITLPRAAQTDKVEAKLSQGVLSLTFQKSDDAKPRKINLKTQ